MAIEFNEFSQGLGLDKYPFSVFTAEEEREFLHVAFVRPVAYSPAIQAATEGKNIFLYGVGNCNPFDQSFAFDLTSRLHRK